MRIKTIFLASAALMMVGSIETASAKNSLRCDVDNSHFYCSNETGDSADRDSNGDGKISGSEVGSGSRRVDRDKRF